MNARLIALAHISLNGATERSVSSVNLELARLALVKSAWNWTRLRWAESARSPKKVGSPYWRQCAAINVSSDTKAAETLNSNTDMNPTSSCHRTLLSSRHSAESEISSRCSAIGFKQPVTVP